MNNAIKIILISLFCSGLFCKEFNEIKQNLERLIQESDIKLSVKPEINETRKRLIDDQVYLQFIEGFCLNELRLILNNLIKYSSDSNILKLYSEQLEQFGIFCDYDIFNEIKFEIEEEIIILSN